MAETATTRIGGGLAGAVAAEWTKFWSLRSTWWGLAAAAGLQLGYSALLALSLRAQYAAGSVSAAELSAPSVAAESVLYLTQLAVLTVASLTIASEYATGSIRSTLQWVPARWRVPVAKCAVLMPVMFGAGVLFSASSIGLGTAVLGGKAPAPDGGAVLGAVAGTGAYLALLSALAIGVGTALRSVAGSIAVTFALLLVAPLLLAGMGMTAAVDYLPGVAGLNLMVVDGQVNPMTSAPAPYGGAVALTITAAWAAVALLTGDRVLRTRDA
ncbi:ABC transporter permease [Amycolatopsis antarctica]|uniref:ABC transporter permease n=2 Tax=Amycolatopsis antarctica TaxID=1854586 RepID=A0A263CZ07_9PSEU|nr:ABC transporter permease [Amycolatopsis antarctica]